jgi:effector-binding domain-containing protein
VTSDRIEIVDVPAVPRGATTIHRGSMAFVDEGYQALFRWAEETGEHIDGYSREIYLACDGDPETWVTELQFALHERGRDTEEET